MNKNRSNCKVQQQKIVHVLPNTHILSRKGYHCFCSSWITQNPPAFLVGSTAAHLANSCECFKLYRQFWKLLRHRHTAASMLSENKTKTMTKVDSREILPQCITQVSPVAIIAFGIHGKTILQCIYYGKLNQKTDKPKGGVLLLTIIQFSALFRLFLYHFVNDEPYNSISHLKN